MFIRNWANLNRSDYNGHVSLFIQIKVQQLSEIRFFWPQFWSSTTPIWENQKQAAWFSREAAVWTCGESKWLTGDSEVSRLDKSVQINLALISINSKSKVNHLKGVLPPTTAFVSESESCLFAKWVNRNHITRNLT